MTTLTVRHNHGDNLAALLDAEQRAWVAVGKNREVKSLLRSIGGREYIKALEIKYSRANGWHPHLHVLHLFNAPISAAALEALNSAMQSAWIASVTKTLGVAPKEGVAVDTRRMTSDTAAYLSKLGYELSNIGENDSRSKSLAPFDLLEQGKMKEWNEYAAATKGKRSIVASQALLADVENRELWDMSLEELEALEYEDRGETPPEPPIALWTLALRRELLMHVTSDYRIARSLYEAADEGRESVEQWAQACYTETGVNAPALYEYCKGPKDMLAGTAPLTKLLAPPEPIGGSLHERLVEERTRRAQRACDHINDGLEYENYLAEKPQELPEWLREEF
jgi:hypothetical protein